MTRGRNKNLTEYVKIKRKIKIFKYTKSVLRWKLKQTLKSKK